MNKKWMYKLVLGLTGVAAIPSVTGCEDLTVRTVVEAKGNNKLYIYNIADTSAHYVIDCAALRCGARLYRDVNPGDTIRGRYMATHHRIYLTLLPDTVARYAIGLDELPTDNNVDAPAVEDKIVQEMAHAHRAKQAVLARRDSVLNQMKQK